MASYDSLKVNALKAKGLVVNRMGADSPVGIKLRYIGTGSVTSVTVTTATDITVITSDGGTDTYLFSAYTTIGAVVDAINADGIFEAKILDVLRSKASASTMKAATVSSTTDAMGNTVWNIVMDTSASLQYATCLSPLAEFDAAKGHIVKLQEIKYAINMGTAAADSVQIWKRKGTVETQIAGWLSVDTTETTINWANGEGFISSDVDGDIIVLVKDAATLADAATNYLQISGVLV